MSLATTLESPPLVYEASDGALCQQFLREFFDFFECAVTVVGNGKHCHQSVRVPCQSSASIRLLGVSVDRCHGNVLFEPLQLGYEIFDLLLDVLGMLRVSMSVMPDSRSLIQYLVMFDERIYPT